MVLCGSGGLFKIRVRMNRVGNLMRAPIGAKLKLSRIVKSAVYDAC